MKHILKIAIYSLLWLTATSCDDDFLSKEDARKYIMYESGAEEYGYATAKVNGHKWRASASYSPDISHPDSFYHISLETTSGAQHFIRESLSIAPIAKFNTGRYDIVGYCGISNWIDLLQNQLVGGLAVMQDDGDVGAALFEIDSDHESWVEIEEWDEETGLMKGRFEIALRLVHQSNDIDNPSRILFEDGYFECFEGDE